MYKKLSIIILFISSFVIAFALLTRFIESYLPENFTPIVHWIVAYAMSFMIVGFMILGSAKNGKVGSLKLPFLFILFILLIGFSAMFLLPVGENIIYLWGFPLPTAVMIYFVWLLPLFVIPVAYALTFDNLTLTDSDLKRIEAVKENRE